MLLSVPPLWGCFNGGFFGVNGTALICRSSNRVQPPRELAFALHKENQRLANKTPEEGRSVDASLNKTEGDGSQSSETPDQGVSALETGLNGAEDQEHEGTKSGGLEASHSASRDETLPGSAEKDVRASAEGGRFEAAKAGTQQACANGGSLAIPGCSEANEDRGASKGVRSGESQNVVEDVLGPRDDRPAESQDEREGTGEVKNEGGPKEESARGTESDSSGVLLEGEPHRDR